MTCTNPYCPCCAEHMGDDELLDGLLTECRRLSGQPTMDHQQAIEWLKVQREWVSS